MHDKSFAVAGRRRGESVSALICLVPVSPAKIGCGMSDYDHDGPERTTEAIARENRLRDARITSHSSRLDEAIEQYGHGSQAVRDIEAEVQDPPL